MVDYLIIYYKISLPEPFGDVTTFERERIGAIELGKAEGLTQGLTQERAEGIQIGEQIGEQRGQINLIKRLLQRQLQRFSLL